MSADLLAQADAYHMKNDHKNAHDCLKAAMDSGNEDPEVMWRLGRAHYLLAEDSEDKKFQQPQIEAGFALTSKALELQPDNWAVHKWHGIVLSGMGKFKSTNDKIADAYIIRDHFKKAVDLNPKDATVAHCLGKWCWSVLQISWVERQAASLLFGTPPTSTYEECEKYLLASHELDKEQTNNTLLLGDMYYQQKKWSDAKKWYEICASLDATEGARLREVNEAKKRAAKC